MTTVLYCRVSTLDQTVEHQRTQAHQNGFTPDLVLSDHGVSGISTRLCERPEGRRLFDILREGDTLVVRWVDRLGRNYQDVTDTVREFIRRGIRIETVINRMVFDGTTSEPMQQAIRDALIAFGGNGAVSSRGHERGSEGRDRPRSRERRRHKISRKETDIYL